MEEQIFENVWEALEDTTFESQNLKLRSDLITWLNSQIKKKGFTQEQAAEWLGVSRPRISDLACGKISKFTLEALIKMVDETKYSVSLSFNPPKRKRSKPKETLAA